MNSDRMNLENQIEAKITHHHAKLISSIIVWLPGVLSEDLIKTLTLVQYKTQENVTTDIFNAYMDEQREVEQGNLTAPAYLQFIIEHSIKKSLTRINDLEGENSGLDALCDQFQGEIKELEEKLRAKDEELKVKQDIINKLKIQALTSLEILEIFTDRDGRHLTHTQRDAYAEVGRGILNKLFPDGVDGVSKKPNYEPF